MKKYFFPLFLSVLTFASCSDLMQEDFESEKFDVSFQGIDESNRVTMDNVVALSTVSTDSTRTSADELTFDCIRDADNDTLLYVCNKRGGGWTLYSSDRRTPPVVAQSDRGSFEELMQIEAARAWVQGLADDIKVIRMLADDQLNFTSGEIEANKNFWKSVIDPDGFVKEVMGVNPTRGLGDDILPPFPGHWELHSTEYGSEVYDSIPRLTQTNWHEEPPYNTYCPLQSNSDSLRAPAGSTAVAAAQMLYFLHSELGVPATAPSAAYCIGNIYDYEMWQGNYTYSIWNNMNINGLSAAPLVANIGYMVGMIYGNGESNADASDLEENVFAPYGISCNYGLYDTTPLKNSLLDGMPVILETSNTSQSKKLTFITDRYKRSRTYVKYTYIWVYNSVNPGVLQPFYNKVEYVYNSPVIQWIGMNWGMGWQYNNDDEWFTLTGDWIKRSINYNTNRNMIYDFQAMDAP